MGDVIQGPWKKIPAEAVEQELRTMAWALAEMEEAADGNTIAPSRWPPARAVIPGLPSGERKQKPDRGLT